MICESFYTPFSMDSMKQRTVNKLYAPNRLREHREAAGLSLEDLAAKTSMAYQTIQKYEKRERQLTINKLNIFARALNKRPEEFFSYNSAAAQQAVEAEEDAVNHSLDRLLDLYRRTDEETRRMFDALHGSLNQGSGRADTKKKLKK